MISASSATLSLIQVTRGVAYGIATIDIVLLCWLFVQIFRSKGHRLRRSFGTWSKSLRRGITIVGVLLGVSGVVLMGIGSPVLAGIGRYEPPPLALYTGGTLLGIALYIAIVIELV